MNREEFYNWRVKHRIHSAQTSNTPSVLVMGILNITPNSFSDGGVLQTLDATLAHAESMIAAGASIIDVGGEATNPGAKPISVDEELERVIPVIKALRRRSSICISIDTYKSEVMDAALNAGADMINDITALADEGALGIAKHYEVPVCLMHMQWNPLTMQQKPDYRNVVEEVFDFLSARVERCLRSGINRDHLIVDPGFGFGKTVEQNLMLLKKLGNFKELNLPILLGVSRKSTIGHVTGQPVNSRLAGSLAASAHALSHGASILRTHDVAQTVQAVKMFTAIKEVTI